MEQFATRRGSALILCILLLTMINLFGVTALRSATIDTQLSRSVDESHSATALADGAIERGILAVVTNSANLPDATPGADRQLADLNDPEIGLMQTRIRFVGKEDYCPDIAPAPAERLHFEVLGTGHAATARQALIQGIAICRDICNIAGCIGTEHPVRRTYRTTAPP